ncbi:DMT family transporter [Paracoccus sp. TK19116]|uniref:DMT family transporter n=1 Tax=Paracoccus albicereus TaxID=2922394 RepID=A0ABT1MNH2_9RHOB|nr:DMT family transporter [Paracoccus albicereus]MCQ0969835.1 DMT family transporter [Paracoccus albicereus]
MTLPLHELAALGAAACWALTGTLVTGAVREVGPFRFNLLRHLLVILLLSAVLFFRTPSGLLDHNAAIILILSGLVGIFIGDTANFAAVGRLGARRAGALFALNAPMAAILGWTVLGETLSGLAIIGIVVTVAGVAVAIIGRPPAHAHRFEQTEGVIRTGILFGLGAALGQAVGALISRPVMEAGIDPYAASLLRVAASGLCMGVVGGAMMAGGRDPGPTRPMTTEVIVAAFATAALGLGLGMTLLLYALSGGKVGIVSTLSATSPVLILPMLWLRTGQRPTAASWTGAAIACIGMALIFLREG